MDGSCYFENDPWTLACNEITHAMPKEDTVEVNVQCVCGKDKAEEMRKKWEQRLQLLLGAPTSSSMICCGRSFSQLLSYPNGAIVRMFADEDNSDDYENFEIVTKRALYIWRPGSHPQGYIKTENTAECVCTQLYSAGLEVL